MRKVFVFISMVAMTTLLLQVPRHRTAEGR